MPDDVTTCLAADKWAELFVEGLMTGHLDDPCRQSELLRLSKLIDPEDDKTQEDDRAA